MTLTDLLRIINENRDAMLAKYPLSTKIIINVHNNMALAVDKAMKSNVTS